MGRPGGLPVRATQTGPSVKPNCPAVPTTAADAPSLKRAAPAGVRCIGHRAAMAATHLSASGVQPHRSVGLGRLRALAGGRSSGSGDASGGAGGSMALTSAGVTAESMVYFEKP